jgi:hypothetical protein
MHYSLMGKPMLPFIDSNLQFKAGLTVYIIDELACRIVRNVLYDLKI